MTDDIFKAATPEEIEKRGKDYIPGLADEIGFSPESLLSKENLTNALYYPAAGFDFDPIERFSKEIDIFIYTDVCLKGFTDLFSGRKKSKLNIGKSQLATLMHIVQADDLPKTEEIDSLIRGKFKGYTFSDGRFRTEPDRTPVGIFQIKTSHGAKHLFYVVNEGYWTYLHLFQMGNITPKILFMHTGGQGASNGGIPAFEGKKGIKVLFKAKPGKIVLKEHMSS